MLAAAVVSGHGDDPYHAVTVATGLAAYAGATAPDWLEHAWWSTRAGKGGGKRLWITHRTWTHWGVAWIALLLFCHANLGIYALAGPGFGFAAGGVTHLLADWPNPLGVPWLLTKRYSLRWWKSGRCDVLIVALVWLAAIATSDQVWWQGRLCRQSLLIGWKFVASLPMPWDAPWRSCLRLIS